MELPMVIYGRTVIATSHSGSDDNIVAKEVVDVLGLEVDDDAQYQKEL